MAKRRGQHEGAARIWEELARDEDWRAAACEELARHEERVRKNFGAALKYAKQAMRQRAKSSKTFGTQTSGEMQRFERLAKRIVRLETRLAKELPLAI